LANFLLKEPIKGPKGPYFLYVCANQKYYTVTTHIETNKNKFHKPKRLQKVKFSREPDFFSKQPNFSAILAGKFCRELATLNMILYFTIYCTADARQADGEGVA
jgi:hypothetical protein